MSIKHASLQVLFPIWFGYVLTKSHLRPVGGGGIQLIRSLNGIMASCIEAVPVETLPFRERRLFLHFKYFFVLGGHPGV